MRLVWRVCHTPARANVFGMALADDWCSSPRRSFILCTSCFENWHLGQHQYHLPASVANSFAHYCCGARASLICAAKLNLDTMCRKNPKNYVWHDGPCRTPASWSAHGLTKWKHLWIQVIYDTCQETVVRSAAVSLKAATNEVYIYWNEWTIPTWYPRVHSEPDGGRVDRPPSQPALRRIPTTYDTQAQLKLTRHQQNGTPAPPIVHSRASLIPSQQRL